MFRRQRQNYDGRAKSSIERGALFLPICNSSANEIIWRSSFTQTVVVNTWFRAIMISFIVFGIVRSLLAGFVKNQPVFCMYNVYLQKSDLNFLLIFYFCQKTGFFAEFWDFLIFSPCLYKYLRTKTNRRSSIKYKYFNFILNLCNFIYKTIKSHKIIINCH